MFSVYDHSTPAATTDCACSTYLGSSNSPISFCPVSLSKAQNHTSNFWVTNQPIWHTIFCDMKYDGVFPYIVHVFIELWQKYYFSVLFQSVAISKCSVKFNWLAHKVLTIHLNALLIKLSCHSILVSKKHKNPHADSLVTTQPWFIASPQTSQQHFCTLITTAVSWKPIYCSTVLCPGEKWSPACSM